MPIERSANSPHREIDIRRRDTGEFTDYVSLDPQAGGTYADKPIWDVPTIATSLNRTEWDWYTNFDGQLDDGVLNFAFFNTQAGLLRHWLHQRQFHASPSRSFSTSRR